MWQTLSDKTKALVLVLLIITFSVIFAWALSGWQLAGLIALVQLIVVWIAKHIWISDKSNFLLRGATLAIVSGVVLFGNAWWQPFIQGIIKQYFPNFPLPDYSVSPITLLFLLMLVTIVFRYTMSESVIEKPEKKITDLIEGPTIKQKWESICESLAAQIRDIDTATNWSHEYYTPLDAEVEMKTSTGTRKVVKDLLEAIKESDDRLFLLIGDPGAGKSVALRKLCLDILKESVKREYIPIYVNLKEWTTKSDWSKTPPTWQDLEAFVKQSLMNKDRYLGDFFEQYYNVLDENGNLFFVLDSFDEIPQVLGTTADAKLIEDLSIVCREFLQGAKQKRSKGILASREYRMPREEYFSAKTTLRVRPFSFEKIENSLTQSGKISKATVEQLLRERPELVPNLRNPFITSLLKAYLADNNNRFPKNQADLFENYIQTSIKKAQARSGHEDLSLDDILTVTTQIAKIIFSEAGLQAPLSMLRQKVIHTHFDTIVEIIRYTRIARGDANNTAHFSFAHRRFYEYFVVQDLLNAGKADLPLENIPTDSRWRDTLVLYCEVASFEEAQRIANYCWFEVIAANNNIRNRASKHSLRFLTEAFRGRQECLVDFHQDLAEYVICQIHKDNDPIDIKLAVEALGILDEENLDYGALLALNLEDTWINDTALRACRHLNEISEELEMKIIRLIDPEVKVFQDSYSLISSAHISQTQFRMGNNELIFCLSLSEAFYESKMIIEWQLKSEKHYNRLSVIVSIILLPILLFMNNQHKTHFGNYDDIIFLVFLLTGIFSLIGNYFFTISAYRKHFKKSKYFNKKRNYLKIFIFWLKPHFLFIIVLIFTALVGLILDYLGIISGWFMSIIILIGMFFLFTFLFIIYTFGKSFLANLNTLKKYKKVDYNRIIQREYIFEMYQKLFSNDLMIWDKFRSKFINDIENNVKCAIGEFPEGFLRVSHSPSMTRLIQLEERWREAEEREAETQNKPKTPKPKIETPLKKTLTDLVSAGQLNEAIERTLNNQTLSKEMERDIVLIKSRLAHLEIERKDGILDNGAYTARLNDITKSFLSFLDELDI